MQLVYEMMSERYQIEMIHWMKLIKLKDKYTKKFQEINVLEINGSRMLISEFMCEFSVTADMTKMVTDGINAADGPLEGMELWIKTFDKGNDGQKAKDDYQSAMVKFDEGNAKIEENMTHYHTSMTLLDKLNRRLENLRLKCLHKPEKESTYQKEINTTLERIERYENEARLHKEKYEMSIQNERNERHSFKNTMTDIKAKFQNFQEERLVAMFGFVKNFVFWLQKLDTERDNRKLVMQKITDVIDSRNPKQEVLQWDLEFTEKRPYPVFKEYRRGSERETKAIAFESRTNPSTSAKKLAIPKQDDVSREEIPSSSLEKSIGKRMETTNHVKNDAEIYQDEIVQQKPTDVKIQNNPVNTTLRSKSVSKATDPAAKTTERTTVCHKDRSPRTKSSNYNEEERVNVPRSKSFGKPTQPKVEMPVPVQVNALPPKSMVIGESDKKTNSKSFGKPTQPKVEMAVPVQVNAIPPKSMVIGESDQKTNSKSFGKPTQPKVEMPASVQVNAIPPKSMVIGESDKKTNSKSFGKPTQPKVEMPVSVQVNAIPPKSMVIGESDKKTKESLSHRRSMNEVTGPVSETTKIIRASNKDQHLSQKPFDGKEHETGSVSRPLPMDKTTTAIFETEKARDLLQDKREKEKLWDIQIEDKETLFDNSQPKPVDKLPNSMVNGENDKKIKEPLTRRKPVSEATKPVSKNTKRIRNRDTDSSQTSFDDKAHETVSVSRPTPVNKTKVAKFETEKATNILQEQSAKGKLGDIQVEDIESFSEEPQPKPVDKPRELYFKHAETPLSQLSTVNTAKQQQDDIMLEDIESFSDDFTSVDNIKVSNFKIEQQSLASHQSDTADNLKRFDDLEDKSTALSRKAMGQQRNSQFKRADKVAKFQHEKIGTPNLVDVQEEDREMPQSKSVVKPTVPFIKMPEASGLNRDQNLKIKSVNSGKEDAASSSLCKISNNQTGTLSNCSVKKIKNHKEGDAIQKHGSEGNERATINQRAVETGNDGSEDISDISELILGEETVVNINTRPKPLLPPKEDTDSSDEDEPQLTDSDYTDIAKLKNVKVVSLEGYTAARQGELSFKMGQTIKQKQAANDQGMAFGYIKKGKLRRKKYGFYPVNIVALKVKSKKTKEKKPKHHKKRNDKRTKDTEDEQDDFKVVRVFKQDSASDADSETATCKYPNKPKEAFGTQTDTNESKNIGATKSLSSKVACSDPPENTEQKGSKSIEGNQSKVTSAESTVETKAKRSKGILKRLFKRHKDE